MIVYELTHLFFCFNNELILDPKKLGFYYSQDSVNQAIKYYVTQPGFCENRKAFSVKKRNVLGEILNEVIYEVIVYIHSKDYEIEIEIELGLYGDAIMAQNVLDQYCRDNASLLNIQDIVFERIVNETKVERREWKEGFSIIP